MSLSSTLTLSDRVGTDVSFVEISREAAGTVRVDPSQTLQAPKKLAIRHSSSGKLAAAVDRHLIQVTKTVLDSNGQPYTATVNLSIAVPRFISSNDVADCVGHIIELLAGGAWSTTTGFTSLNNLNAILRGES